MIDHSVHYAILGDGRLGRHLRQYLTLLGQRCSGWSRNLASPFNTHHDTEAETRLRRTIAPASHVLLLVTDDAISGLVRRYPVLHRHRLVHCAGAVRLPGIAGAHPLMTFADRLYTLEQYRRIPFLVESGYCFDHLFPGLPNPHHTVPVGQKALYHALCVAAGNFPQILWQAVAERFAGELDIPAAALEPYLRQSLENWLADPAGALTGPLARGDAQTVSRNLAALDGDALRELYAAFVAFHRPETGVRPWPRRERAS
jgi:predicted short-subunit dehydrogenase-like oxidoreductase (DUF2520 family)